MLQSLKKAGNLLVSRWSSSDVDQVESIRFARRTIGITGRGGGDILLRNLVSRKNDLP